MAENPQQEEIDEIEREARYQDDGKSWLYTGGIGVSIMIAPFCLYRIYKCVFRAKKMFDIQIALEDDDLTKVRPDKYCLINGTA